MSILAKPIIAGLRRLDPGADRPGRRPIHSVLLAELTALGDAVTLLYVVRALKVSLPDASIHLLVDSRFAPLLRELSRDTFTHGIRRPDRPSGVLRALREARRLNVDLALSVSPAYRNAAVVLGSRAPMRGGYLRTGGSTAPSRIVNPLEGIGFESPPGLFYRDEGWLERRWKLFDLIGIRRREDVSRFELPEKLKADGLTNLRSLGIVNGRAYLVIHPFASWQYRAWPAASYILLIERLLREFPLDVVVLGGPADAARLRRFEEHFPHSGRVRCYASDGLLESAVLIGSARGLIGNDSGPLHLAGVVGTPALGIYGPSHPRNTAPPLVLSVYRNVPCSPCAQVRCGVPGHPCMSGLPVEEVLAAVRSLLGQEGSAGEETR